MKLLTKDPNAKDIRYRNIQEDLPWLTAARSHIEELYSITEDVLDRNFTEEIKHAFSARYAEMYFAGVLKNRLSLNVQHPSDEGADFFVSDYNCWVEVVTASDGKTGELNSLPKRSVNESYSYPEGKVILRFTSVFDCKSKKTKSDIRKGLISADQPIVIFISGGGLSEPFPMQADGGYPEIFKALLPIGDLTLKIQRDTNEVISHEYLFRAGIEKQKQDGEEFIHTSYFLEEDHSHISAVVYSWADPFNPTQRDSWGSDFFTIHNPKAKNKLEEGFLKCGKEYKVSIVDHAFKIHPLKDYENS